MKERLRLRDKLTYANVMVTILAVMALGGGVAYGASQLGKNSVGTKQLKRNAVTSPKIKNGAVTSAKIRPGAITDAQISAISGAKIDVSTLSMVPSAENAGMVNGQTLEEIGAILASGQSGQIASIAGFTFNASCSSDNLSIILTAPKGVGSVLAAEGYNLHAEVGKNNFGRLKAAQATQPPASIALDGELEGSYGHTSFSGGLSNGTVISGEIGYDYDTFFGEAPERCMVFGEVATG